MPLTTLIDLQGWAGWAAALAPFLLLAMAIVVALREPGPGRDRADDGAARERAAAEPAALDPVAPVAPQPHPSQPHAPQPHAPQPHAPRPHTPQPPAREPQPVEPRALRTGPVPPSSSPSQVPPAANRARPVVAPPAAPPAAAPASITPPAPAAAKPAVTAAEISSLRTRLHAAEAALDNAGVARLSLELGRRMVENGGVGEDVEKHFRRAIIAASQLGDTATHAAARLELGDRVAARGDMTTACEHWQIARQIFWDESREADLAEADRRMIAAGCPTDWVLNDF